MHNSPARPNGIRIKLRCFHLEVVKEEYLFNLLQGIHWWLGSWKYRTRPALSYLILFVVRIEIDCLLIPQRLGKDKPLFRVPKYPFYNGDSSKIFLEFYGEKVSNRLIIYARSGGWNLLGNRGCNKFKGRTAMGRWGLGIPPREMPSRLVYTKVTIDGVTVRT